MPFVPMGNQIPFPPNSAKRYGPSRERGEHLERTHDGTGGLGANEPRQPSPEDVIEGWPRADQL
jgi:hypothetical protein